MGSRASTAARAFTSSAMTSADITSTTLNGGGPAGSGWLAGRSGRLRVTVSRARSGPRRPPVRSSGTTWAPVPLVSVSSTHVLATRSTLAFAPRGLGRKQRDGGLAPVRGAGGIARDDRRLGAQGMGSHEQRPGLGRERQLDGRRVRARDGELAMGERQDALGGRLAT